MSSELVHIVDMFEIAQHAQIIELLRVWNSGQDDLFFAGVKHFLYEIYDEIENAGVVPRSKGNEVDQSKDIIEKDETIVALLRIFKDSHDFIHNLPLIQSQKSITIDDFSEGRLIDEGTLGCKDSLSSTNISSNQECMLSILEIVDGCWDVVSYLFISRYFDEVCGDYRI